MPQVHNSDGLIKSSVSSESWREYCFTDGMVYRIDKPCTLYVKRKPDGDSHRVVDHEGVVHYVPAGWRIVRWKNEPEQPEVEF